ncbi:PAS domain S-box protein [Sphingomonas sp. LaA6.9]|uniref:sensor histidine kinase n=1 Tax=Sphingomonas sp. LaA6.9 TaxID=2919914 RepID=UPI0032AF5650
MTSAESQDVQASEALLRSILATVPDAMVVIDTDGAIIDFSAAAERMFGYARADVLGRNVNILMPSPDRERHDGYIERYLNTGVPRIIGIGRITVGRRANGETFPMELSIGEARTDHSRVFTGFVRDLTERQQAEIRLKELQNELAHVSRISAMGTMASSLAHELNQPLTAVANYLEAARDLLAEPGVEDIAIVREALDDAARQSVRAGQIVRGLRDFIGRGDTEKRIESLGRLVSEANALALIGIREMDVDVDIQLDPQADRVLVDRVQVQQILVNLIRNALEAMTEGPKRLLTIRTRRISHDQVRVSVADSGSGIAPEIRERLFQPFLTTKDDGMGLGLSICQTILEAQGGSIWAEAAPEGGTIFSFTLDCGEME